MQKKTTVKKIKESVKESEYKKLMNYVRGDESIRENTRLNLLRTFCILYFTGMRINELQNLKIKDIKELIENSSVKVYLSKTNSERKLYLTPSFKKDLEKLFDFENENLESKVIAKGSNKNKKTSIHPLVFITQVNSYMKTVLGEGYTSHSFRQGLISEMGAKGINVKIISKYIAHSDVKTTMRYITPTDEDIMSNLVR